MATTPNRNYPLVAATDQLSLDVLKLIALVGMIDADMQAVFSALSGKADLAGATFTTSPTGPTPAAGDDSGKMATTSFVKTALINGLANFVGAAPAALDTWLELVAAVQNDETALAALTTVVGNKANSADVYLKTAIDTMLALKLAASGGTMSSGIVADTNSIRLKDSASPSEAGEIAFKRATGGLHLFDGSKVVSLYPGISAIIEQQLASGTSGGATSAGTANTVPLNTLVHDPAGIVTAFSANKFTLAAGKYIIKWFVPAYYSGRARANLYNVTGASYAGLGMAMVLEQAGSVYSCLCTGVCKVDLAVATQFRLDLYTQLGWSVGLGYPSSDGNAERYARVEISRIG